MAILTNQPVPHNPLEGQQSEINLNLHDGSDEQISIIIVHKDRPEYLNLCLQSITVCSFNNNYEIIVVDNASGKESQDFLDSIDGDIKVIRNDKNLYWSGAANRGAEAASKNSKHLCFMHCDVVVLNPGWLDILTSVSESRNSGMVGVQMGSYVLDNKQKIDYIQEWCVLISRECWKHAGPFSEELPFIGHSFIFSVKAQRMGYLPQAMRNTILHHYQIFSLSSTSEWERLLEPAMIEIPKQLRAIEAQSVSGGI